MQVEKDSKAVAVTLVRNAAEPGGRNLFCCSQADWDLLLELGRAFGWQPHGASYRSASSASAAAEPVRHGYRPGEPRDLKCVDADDAAEWSAALNRARDFPQFGQLLASYQRDAHFVAVLGEFIEYGYGGAFSFSMSTSSDA